MLNRFIIQLKNTPGVKETELKWIGLEGFLKDKNKKQFLQEEVLEFIEANRIDINEVKFGGAANDYGMYKKKFK